MLCRYIEHRMGLICAPKRGVAIIWLLATFVIVKFLRVNEAVTKGYTSMRGYNKDPTILVWSPAPSQQRIFIKEGIPDGFQMERKCGGCYYTYDKSVLSRSDVVVLHEDFKGKGFLSNGSRRQEVEIPSIRYAHQIYVFYTRENPYHTMFAFNLSLKNFDDVFNMTMTYRRDSDIVFPYGCWSGILNGANELNIGSNKKLAIMMASDCWRAGGKLRKIYSDELIKAGLSLERYGKCFGQRYHGNANELIMQFKFFMAFENTLNCRDYITEKFWYRSLGLGVVPVVWGPSKKDVERVAPPNSFIHVADFKSPRHLTEYLLYLDRNHTAYMNYFRWRNAIKSNKPRTESGCGDIMLLGKVKVKQAFCDLCKKVTAGFKGSVNISQWWYGTENKECLENNMAVLSKYHSKEYGVPPGLEHR